MAELWVVEVADAIKQTAQACLLGGHSDGPPTLSYPSTGQERSSFTGYYRGKMLDLESGSAHHICSGGAGILSPVLLLMLLPVSLIPHPSTREILSVSHFTPVDIGPTVFASMDCLMV